MNNKEAIQVRDLGKEYRLGKHRGRYRTLRESLAGLASVPGRWLSGSRVRRSRSESVWALRNVTFDIEQGDVVGVIGRNGAGKSTLLKILSRITEPTEGMVEIRGRVGSLLEVGTGFHPELTGGENIYLNGAILGMRRAEIRRAFDEMVAFAEIEKFIDTPVKFYSSGMYLRLAFAVAAHLEPEILLVDEVLAVGDVQFQAKCLGKMRSVAHAGRTVLFVSHNMEAILSLCPRCVVIGDGMVAFDGPSEAAVGFYYEQLAPKNRELEPHIVYVAPADTATETAWISRLELLDGEGKPRSATSTWDDVVFRVQYESREEIRNGSIILELRDMKNQRLLVFDSGLRLPLKKGRHHVDCRVPRLPLPAGQFFLGAGLSRVGGGWIWRDPNLAPFRVLARDVLALGRPPAYARMAFVAEHAWSETETGSGAPELDDETGGESVTVGPR